MERDIWRWIAKGLKRLPRTLTPGQQYHTHEVLAILLWSALHDRSILWACQRCNWPVQAWRRRLPNQSTLSRRLRDPSIIADLTRLMQILQRTLPDDQTIIIVDGKPLPVSEYTHDREACNGRGAGRYERGYKLHVLIDATWRLLAWHVEPMNTAECVVARRLVQQAAQSKTLPQTAIMLGDAAYDSNSLYETAAHEQIQLIAPRRKAHRSISSSYRQHPNRLQAIALTEHNGPLNKQLRAMRSRVEHYLGALASTGGGLHSLPAWSRRLVRVRYWIGAKLAIHAARNALRGVNYA
jgi:hypothetical protein